MWIGVGRVIDDRFGIEHDHIREHAIPQQPTIADTEPVGNRGAGLPDRILPCHPSQLAHIPSQNARVGAVGARVHQPAIRHPLGVDAARVGAELDPRLFELQLHVFLAHGEVHREDVPSILHVEQVNDGLFPVHAQRVRNLGQPAALVLPVLRVRDLREDDVLRPCTRAEVLPRRCRALHLLHDLRTHLGVAQVLPPLAVRLRPWRHAGRQPGAGPIVRIHVRADIDAPRAVLVDAADDLRHLRPVVHARRLEVVDLRDDPCSLRDLERLLIPLVEVIAF